MSSYVYLHCLVEGPTEQIFIERILTPYFSGKNILISCSLIGKRGGDIRFARAKNDLKKFLLGNTNYYLTFMIDFYGTPKKDWPGLSEACHKSTSQNKAKAVHQATSDAVAALIPDDAHRRFIPYISMHEFEALLFSEPKVLANELDVDVSLIDNILHSSSPEEINHSVHTAPSKRLEALMPRYKKTITGIAIAEKIGIDKMRSSCPLFNQWLQKIESLPSAMS